MSLKIKTTRKKERKHERKEIMKKIEGLTDK